jgi:uncharacterized protein DUF5710
MSRRQSAKSIMRDANALSQLWRGGGRYEDPSPELKSFHKDHEWEEPKTRIRLDVPFQEKDQAKALGARWDAVEKTWYAVFPYGRIEEMASIRADHVAARIARCQKAGSNKHGYGGKPKAKPKEGFALYDPAHEFAERFPDNLKRNP